MPKNWAAVPASPRRATRSAALAVLAALALAGCSVPAEEADDRPLVVTTFTVIADLVSEVGGERVRVESITRVGAEIHGYEPTPGDLRRAQGADLIIDNGLNLEAWFEQFLENLDVPRVVASAGIEPIAIAGTTAPNPHAWMSPVAAESYVETIRAALTDLDPEGAPEFASNAAAYTAELRALAAELGATWIEPEEALTTPADILVPAGLGGVLTAETIDSLPVRAVVGPANNPLAEREGATLLEERGILYAPDFLVNAGGVIHLALIAEGATSAALDARLHAIGDTLARVLDAAESEGITPLAAAEPIAFDRVSAASR